MMIAKLLPIILLCLATSCSSNNKQSVSDIEYDNSLKLCQSFYENFPKEFDLSRAARHMYEDFDHNANQFYKKLLQSQSVEDDGIYVEVQKHPCFEYLYRDMMSIDKVLQKDPVLARFKVGEMFANSARYHIKALKITKENGINTAMFFGVVGVLNREETKEGENKNDKSKK